METSPLKCVLDTNIVIDFHEGDVLDALFSLPFTFFAPDLLLVSEFLSVDPIYLHRLGLAVHSLSGEQVIEIIALGQQARRPSFQDLAAFVLARNLSAVLLTGDRDLRRMASAHGIPHHGTLWLLDELVARRLLAPRQAGQALQRMLNSGSRLPAGECTRRLHRWRGP